MKIGIIGAMDMEVDSLKADAAVSHVEKKENMEFYEGKLGGRDVVIVRCGIGKVSAAICAQILVDDFHVTHVINTGAAGSLDAKLDIGDVVISTEAVEHDFDVSQIGFKKGEHPYINMQNFPASVELRKQALQAVKEAAPDIRAMEGRICSGDQFISSQVKKEEIIREFGGSCVEMEGGAIAHACYLSDVPFVIIRAISDKADDSSQVSFDEFARKAAERGAAIVKSMVEHWPETE